MEIERKFLIDEFPELPVLLEGYVFQGYLNFEPEVRLRFVMFNNTPQSFWLTFKSGGDLIRKEVEIPLTFEQFLQLQTFMSAPFLCKQFKQLQLPNGHKMDCSNVNDGELIYCEVEFSSVEEANNFEVPSFFGTEVTNDSTYKMKNFYRRRYKV